MRMIVAYDIADPRRLQRVAKIVKDYGVRVQKSVFEVEVSETVLAKMRKRVEKVIDFAQDEVKYFPLCGQCGGLYVSLGAPVVELPDGPWRIY